MYNGFRHHILKFYCFTVINLLIAQISIKQVRSVQCYKKSKSLNHDTYRRTICRKIWNNYMGQHVCIMIVVLGYNIAHCGTTLLYLPSCQILTIFHEEGQHLLQKGLFIEDFQQVLPILYPLYSL